VSSSESAPDFVPASIPSDIGNQSEYVFGNFRLIPSQRLLLDDQQAIELGSRAFDLLVCLVQRAGQVVTNADLMATVWSDTVVDIGSLRVHISALRKALQESGSARRFIVNVPLKGYSFVAPVTESDGARALSPKAVQKTDQPHAVPAPRQDSVPPLLTRVIGRDGIVDALVVAMPAQRCISIVGAGGIGKTTVATVLARKLGELHSYPVVFVSIAPALDSVQALFALASALGVPTGNHETIEGILNLVRQRRMLLVLDNCEHVIDTIAEITEQVLRAAPLIHVLATSREPLRIDGEWVYRLDSLEVPDAADSISASTASMYPAVALFVERATSSADGFNLDDANVSIVCEICRRLDGIPLAIELAAASVNPLGLRELRDRLSIRLSLLKRGRRTALPRHQTLQATLDWSYELLSDSERLLLRRVSAFIGSFTLDAAVSLATGDTDQDVFLAAAEDISGLTSKSLLVADVTRDPVEYRLLEMTRAYGLDKLNAAGEGAEVSRRHAVYFDDLVSRRPPDSDPVALSAWVKAHAPRIADIRAAIHWGFSDNNLGLAVRLTANSATLWFELSRLGEFRALGERAAAAVKEGTQVQEETEMRLCEALGHALWNTQAGSAEVASAFSRALELADKFGSTDLQRRSLWGLWLNCNADGSYDGSVSQARRFGRTVAAASQRRFDLTYSRMMALGLHLHGDQSRALVYGNHVLNYRAVVSQATSKIGFQFDQRVAAHTVLARTLWVHGLPEQAMEHARAAVNDGLRLGHSLSLCYALAMGAVPVAIWSGHIEEARRFNSLLLRHSTEHSLHFWRNFGVYYPMALDPADVEPSDADQRPTSTLPPTVLLRETLATLDESLVDDVTLRRADSRLASWCLPELMRILVVRRTRGGTLSSENEQLLRKAIELSQGQQALSWQLRCGLTLAERLEAAGRRDDARATLEPILAQVKEGGKSNVVVRSDELLGRL
jgi:predicted ATPase/DNA-binding winged helix-turn-helix (wHTH) protein